MSSAAQVLANQANARHSTGPVTDEGKARVAANRLTHGLAGSEFRLLPWESPEQFTDFASTTRAEYNPQTNEEERLVHSIIQHYWLMQRALTMQDGLICEDNLNDADQKRLSPAYALPDHQRTLLLQGHERTENNQETANWL